MKLAFAAVALLAHFTATSVSGTATRTCGAVTATNATYSGPTMTISARSTIDSQTGMGFVTGTLHSASLTAQFTAVYDHGALSGTASGHRGARTLVTTLSAAFSPTGGFTRGVIGGGDAGGTAVVSSACSAEPQVQLRHATGVVKLANAAEITVGRLDCAVPTRLSIEVAFSHPPGSTASITCSVSNGVTTLVTIDKKR